MSHKKEKSEKGATLIEYGLICLLVIVGVVAIAISLRGSVTSMFSSADSGIASN